MTNVSPLRSLLIGFLAFAALSAAAQTNIRLGAISADPSAPVEVGADSLVIVPETGTAVFSGNVQITQGDLLITAGEVEVIYVEETGKIDRLAVRGGVVFTGPSESARADTADYDISGGVLVLRGNVVLTQGASAISAGEMTVNLVTGQAVLQGRVRTTLQQTGGN